MTPVQRRWKWVAYDSLPEDMKPFMGGGKSNDFPCEHCDKVFQSSSDLRRHVKEAHGDDKKGAEAQDDNEAAQIEIVDERELDYTKLDIAQPII